MGESLFLELYKTLHNFRHLWVSCEHVGQGECVERRSDHDPLHLTKTNIIVIVIVIVMIIIMMIIITQIPLLLVKTNIIVIVIVIIVTVIIMIMIINESTPPCQDRPTKPRNHPPPES